MRRKIIQSFHATHENLKKNVYNLQNFAKKVWTLERFEIFFKFSWLDLLSVCYAKKLRKIANVSEPAANFFLALLHFATSWDVFGSSQIWLRKLLRKHCNWKTINKTYRKFRQKNTKIQKIRYLWKETIVFRPSKQSSILFGSQKVDTQLKGVKLHWQWPLHQTSLNSPRFGTKSSCYCWKRNLEREKFNQGLISKE